MINASKDREFFPTGSRREAVEVEDRDAVQRDFADDEVCSSAGQHTSDRGGQPKTVLGCQKLLHRLLLKCESGRK